MSTLPKRRKHSRLTKFFQKNIKDLKNTWKGLKKDYLIEKFKTNIS